MEKLDEVPLPVLSPQVRRLLQSVTNRDQPQVRQLLRLGVAGLVNLTEPSDGRSALHAAAANNLTDMVHFLLSQGADPGVQDGAGRTAVMLAAQLGHDGVVALLAGDRATSSIVDHEGKGVLFCCVASSGPHLRCLQLLLGADADVNNVSAAGKPVLLAACEVARQEVGVALSLLEGGADPNIGHQVTGHTALMEACRAGLVELVRAILQRGGNPNARDDRNMTAAHMAAERGFFEALVLLSAYGADLAAVAGNQTNALHLAAAGGCSSKQKNSEGLLPRHMTRDKTTIKELKKAERLQAKASKPGAGEPDLWRTALHDWACERQEALRIAMETQEMEGPVDDVSLKTSSVSADQSVWWILQIVQEHDRNRDGLINLSDFFRGVHFLQKAFTLPSYAPKERKTGKGGRRRKKGKFVLPLPVCVLPPPLTRRHPNGGPPLFMIERFWSSDRPPHHPIMDDSAWSMEEPDRVFVSISRCVKAADLESLSLAFSHGVPVDVQDRFYKTPLMMACSSGDLQVAEFLIGCGADVNMCDQFNWTPLHHACSASRLDVVQLLVACGAELDAVSISGATPLMKAIESCRPACVDILIRAGANVQTQNKQGQSCLDVTRRYGNSTITRLVQDQLDSLPKPKEQKKKT
uniref:Uncharacterized protein n=1 Tax=Myripristis murdjan TaxID=586833 RepID=A0A667Z7H9_9TELE